MPDTKIADTESSARFIRLNEQFIALLSLHERVILEEVEINDGKILSWTIRQANSKKGKAS